jgi:hypothetical protein
VNAEQRPVIVDQLELLFLLGKSDHQLTVPAGAVGHVKPTDIKERFAPKER